MTLKDRSKSPPVKTGLKKETQRELGLQTSLLAMIMTGEEEDEEDEGGDDRARTERTRISRRRQLYHPGPSPSLKTGK